MSDTTYVVQIDPPGIATNRTMLDLNTGGIQVGGEGPGQGIDWGDAAIQTYEATQVWGQPVVDFRVPNRTVTIPLALGVDGSSEEAARAALQQKVGLLQSEGGWLMRQRSGGIPQYADIVNATLTLPDLWGEAGNVEPDVQLVLECLPDFYGDELTLDSVAATGVYSSVLVTGGFQAAVMGDYPGRARIVVTDTSGNNQNGAIWGFRSKHYDSSSTAALVYQAENMLPLNGAIVTGLAGSSGGNVVYFSPLPFQTWTAVLATPLVSGTANLTHAGSYQVWARVYSAAGAPHFRLVWGAGSLASPSTNADTGAIPGSGAFYLVNLGNVRIDAPPVGTNQWSGIIQAYGGLAEDAQIDEVFFVPLDESAGYMNSVQSASAGGITVGPMYPTTGVSITGVGTIAWTNPGNIDVDDGNVATAVLSASATSRYLQGTGYGFAIPSGATINGIQVDIRRMCLLSGHNTVTDARVRLVKASVIQTTDRALTTTLWPNSLTDQTYGGPADLWGGTWAPSDINNAGFGAVLAATGSGSPTAEVDSISITIYYSVGTFGAASDVVVAANGTAEFRWNGMYREDPNTGPYGPVTNVLGDLARIPPSWLEGRAVQLFVKPSRGDLNSVADGGLDAFTAQVIYRPCWIGRP